MHENFINHPAIAPIANKKRWTVATNGKMPIDMLELCRTKRVVGAKMTDDHNPYLTLYDCHRVLPCATNYTLKLIASIDNIVVLDVEPSCPYELKQKLLTLPYIYGEYSMSGYGFHLVFPAPKTHQDVLLQVERVCEENHYYEIMCNHYITFTDNQFLCPSQETINNATITFDEIWDELASKANMKRVEHGDYENKKPKNIPNEERIQQLLFPVSYSKDKNDFLKGDGTPDNSKYEFGYGSYLYFRLKNILAVYPEHEYTNTEKAWLLYDAMRSKIEYRQKHDTERNNMPWLFYVATRVIDLSDNNENS